MYLSRIALDTGRRGTQRALSVPHILHGAVEQGFEPSDSRRLWRIDWLHDICYLLVLSESIPDLTHISDQFGLPSVQPLWETKDYNTLLTRLEVGQEWHFRLCANPTRSSYKEKDKERGRVFAHVTSEQQKRWLLSRAERCGFTLQENGFDVVHSRWFKFDKGKQGNHVSLRMATYEGRLVINNVEAFIQTLVNGVGRGKAYGCGLLTIARAMTGMP